MPEQQASAYKQFLVREKRDADALVRLLNSLVENHPHPKMARVAHCKAERAFDGKVCRWAVRHNMPEWIVRKARNQAGKRGAMRQVEYLERHLRESFPID